MASLQDQFLKAGLVNKKKVKQVTHEKSNQKKDERRTGTQTVDEARLAALKEAGLDHIQLSFQDATKEANDLITNRVDRANVVNEFAF